ncbi:MAG: polyphosphate kinase 2 family protein [Robiginitomaculum sp.]|nr:polyphosphate kinase 2 family protein [Robiginitomaculum sp.]
MKVLADDFLARPEDPFTLKDHPARVNLYKNKKQARAHIKTEAKLIAPLAHRLYGQNTQSLLIVLQGMDTSGKDGTISAIFSRTPPLNVRVQAFVKPSKRELSHDYLWRVHNVCPPKGGITVFNRSHYEDVLVVKVRKFVSEAEIENRYEQINQFEKHLVQNGMKILKFMLNISKDQQAIRLKERLVEPHKFWKFNPSDLDDRMLWPDFMDAYQTMVRRTSTPHAPWHIIPSDQRATRSAIITSIVRDTLEGMNPQYPEAEFTKDDFLIR